MSLLFIHYFRVRLVTSGCIWTYIGARGITKGSAFGVRWMRWSQFPKLPKHLDSVKVNNNVIHIICCHKLNGRHMPV